MIARMTVAVGLAALLTVPGCANTKRSGEEACTPPSLFEVFWVNDLGIGASDFDRRIEECNKQNLDNLKARVEKDSAEKRQKLLLKARQGDAESQFLLGMSFYPWARKDWRNHPQAGAKSAGWLCRAANQGFAQAEFRLGLLSENGFAPIKKDAVQAYAFYGRAALHGDKRGSDSRDKLADKMTPKQIAQAKRLLRKGSPEPRQCAAVTGGAKAEE